MTALRTSILNRAAVAAACALSWTAPVGATEPVVSDYMLACQGCHLADGSGHPDRGVPRMTGYVAKFLAVPGGREFLVQVPGSAQSSLSDARLATLLNWMLKTFSPGQIPASFVPYSADEVGRLRRHPLAQVADARAELVRRIDKPAP